MPMMNDAAITTKAGWLTVCLSTITNWWVEWGSVVGDIVVTLLTIVLTSVLILVNLKQLRSKSKKK